MLNSSITSKNLRPINIMVLYNIGTLLLFLISAWNYRITNYLQIIFVVVVNLLALYLGYLLALFSKKKTSLYDIESISIDEKDKIITCCSFSIISFRIWEYMNFTKFYS